MMIKNIKTNSEINKIEFASLRAISFRKTIL